MDWAMTPDPPRGWTPRGSRTRGPAPAGLGRGHLWVLAYGTRVEEARLHFRPSDRMTYWPVPALLGAVQWKISAAAMAASASPARARFPNPFANTTN